MSKSGSTRRRSAFDIRVIVGALLGIYGLILVITGTVRHTSADLTKTDNFNLNLWAGIGMLAVSAAFIAWSLLRPVVVAPTADHATSGTSTGEPSSTAWPRSGS